MKFKTVKEYVDCQRSQNVKGPYKIPKYLIGPPISLPPIKLNIEEIEATIAVQNALENN